MGQCYSATPRGWDLPRHPQQEWGIALQGKLLASAARTALSLAILGACMLGEPEPRVRAAMGFRAESTAWTLVPLLPVHSTPTASLPDRTLDPMPQITCTPSPTPAPARPPAQGPPTWIEAPAIDLSAPVVEVGWRVTFPGGVETIEWEVPDMAAGFHKTSAFPGHTGNTVISGHHNIGSEVFRDLVDLSLGDEIILYVGKTPYRYQVVHKEIVPEAGVSDEVRRQNGRWILPTSDERLTLVTCWPYTGNSHRLIVVAMPAP